MILLDALYINNSGGKVLLDYLVEELHRANLPVFYLLDERVEGSYPFLQRDRTTYLKANLLTRHRFYQKRPDRWSKVLCFGNIPPSVTLTGTVFTYFHQLQYLQIPKTLPLKKQIILLFKKEIVYWSRRNTTYWLVQSKHIKDLLEEKWGIPSSRIQLVPFFSVMPPGLVDRFPVEKKQKRFVYVSDGNPHKNHEKLLSAFEAAWQGLKGISLDLTISNNYPQLQKRIAEMRDRGVPVYNHGKVPKSEVYQLYADCQFVIYPSLSESFGLGIVEGIKMGCKIIGAHLPYMHAVCKPSTTFNPHNEKEIQSAIERSQRDILPESALCVKNEMDKLIELLRIN